MSFRRSIRWWLSRLVFAALGSVYIISMTKTHSKALASNAHLKDTELGHFLNGIPDPTPTSSDDTVQKTTKLETPKLEIAKLETTKLETPKLETPKLEILEKLDAFYNISSDGTNLWDKSTLLPKWIKQYLNWHRHKRKHLSEATWESERFFVMQCLGGHDAHCGGTADRLKPILWALRMAYRSRRILLIHWTKPAPLELFLVPPKGGIDWRAPKWFANKINNRSNGLRLPLADKDSMIMQNSDAPMVRSIYQNYHGGMHIYDSQRFEAEEPSFSDIYLPIW
jgi:hypothetical protein